VDEESNLGLLYEAEELSSRLPQDSLERNNQEPEEQWARRVAGLAKRAWEESTVALELGTQPKAIPPPPTENIVEWVRDAAERATETGRSVQARLPRMLLAYRYDLTEDQVRGRIDVARKLNGKPGSL
jgi:hypothetical protein